MNYARLGAYLREKRLGLGLRQCDVAVRAGVSQTFVSKVERGELRGASIELVERTALVVGVVLDLVPRYDRAEMDRLLDMRHAALVEETIARLAGLGWELVPEETFSEFGERGAVDLLGWHAERRALAVFEMKTDLVDLQATLSGLGRKTRLMPSVVARTRGWRADGVASILVLLDSVGQRRAVERHAATFAAALPARTVEVRRWLAAPSGSLRGLWFISSSTGDAAGRARRGRRGRRGAPRRRS